ncbi:MAG: DUF2953 domain-containing protein [Clostridia bacterium]|nr:DUF2953 domain-containing protein [Clostridia bacterium]
MIALYIIGGILVLLALILLARVSITLGYCGGLFVTLKIGFLRFTGDAAGFTGKEELPERAETGEKRDKDEGEDVSAKEMLSLARETLAALLKKIKKNIKLKRFVLKINVASHDPALTGVLYGAVCAAAGSLTALIAKIKRRSRKKDAVYTEITPDFISDKTDIYFETVLTTRLWRALGILLPLIKGYRKYRGMKRRKEIQK